MQREMLVWLALAVGAVLLPKKASGELCWRGTPVWGPAHEYTETYDFGVVAISGAMASSYLRSASGIASVLVKNVSDPLWEGAYVNCWAYAWADAYVDYHWDYWPPYNPCQLWQYATYIHTCTAITTGTAYVKVGANYEESGWDGRHVEAYLPPEDNFYQDENPLPEVKEDCGMFLHFSHSRRMQGFTGGIMYGDHVSTYTWVYYHCYAHPDCYRDPRFCKRDFKWPNDILRFLHEYRKIDLRDFPTSAYAEAEKTGDGYGIGSSSFSRLH